MPITLNQVTSIESGVLSLMSQTESALQATTVAGKIAGAQGVVQQAASVASAAGAGSSTLNVLNQANSVLSVASVAASVAPTLLSLFSGLFASLKSAFSK